MHAAKDKNNSTDLTCLLHSQSGQTPLLVAIYHNHVDVVDILLGFPAIEPNWASPVSKNEGVYQFDWLIDVRFGIRRHFHVMGEHRIVITGQTG